MATATAAPAYYAEHSTDKIIREAYFRDREYKGVVVEVGGGTPEFLSMSKHFKDSGWRSIVVEPNPMFAKMHREMGNEVYQFACGTENKTGVPFTVVSQEVEAYGGLVTDHSFSSLALKPNFLKILPKDAVRKMITVDVKRLDTLLTELGVTKVDLLSIDVEGWELEVMKGLDTKRIDCRVIVLENLHHEATYAKYMRTIGYEVDKKVEYNYVFIKRR